jgi:periplasmic copper chaperone A
MKRLLLFAALLLAAIALAACGSDEGLQVENVQANLTLPTETGAVYMTITNQSDEDERLLGAMVPGCGSIELHEMAMTDDVMVMRQVEGGEILIPAGQTVELKQGGLHVMCLGKTGQFAVGDTVEVTLAFANAGMMVVTAEVIAPGAMGSEMDQ